MFKRKKIAVNADGVAGNVLPEKRITTFCVQVSNYFYEVFNYNMYSIIVIYNIMVSTYDNRDERQNWINMYCLARSYILNVIVETCNAHSRMCNFYISSSKSPMTNVLGTKNDYVGNPKRFFFAFSVNI